MTASSTNKPSRELATRIVVGVALIALAIAALWAGGLVFALLVATGALLMLAEWSQITRISRKWLRPALAIVALAVLLVPAYRTIPPYVALIWLSAGLTAAALLLAVLSRRAMLALGIMYAGLSGIALVWLRLQPNGFGLVLWTLGVVWATDIFAYFAGRTIGGPKLAPRISPKKTWAGLIGGVLGAGAFGWLVATRFDLPALFSVIGAAMAVLAQIGDLFESWLKRRAGVKDSGTLLPAHGGALDRLDGLVPVAIAVAVLVAGKAILG